MPECQKNFHRFESALLAEVGFYRNFDVNATNGKPICDAMNKKQTKVTLCDKEEYDPEGNIIFSWFLDDFLADFSDDFSFDFSDNFSDDFSDDMNSKYFIDSLSYILVSNEKKNIFKTRSILKGKSK